jgi:MFS family permease
VTILRSYGRLYRGLPVEARCFLWLSAFVEFAYIGIYLVGFNLYLLRLGYGPGFAGIATGSAIAVFSLTTLAAGYVFHGRSFRGLIVRGGVLFVAGLIGVAITDLVPQAARTPWVLVSNAIAWLGGALYSVGRPPYLVAVVPEQRRVELFALERVLGISLGALGCLAVAIVPGIAAAALGTSLDDPAPYRTTLLLAPVGLGVALARFAAAPPATPIADQVDEAAVARARRPGAASPMRLIVLVSLCTLLLNMAFAPPQYLFNVYLEQGLAAPAPLIALVMTAARLASVPATVFLPAVGAR